MSLKDKVRLMQQFFYWDHLDCDFNAMFIVLDVLEKMYPNTDEDELLGMITNKDRDNLYQRCVIYLEGHHHEFR